MSGRRVNGRWVAEEFVGAVFGVILFAWLSLSDIVIVLSSSLVRSIISGSAMECMMYDMDR